MIKTLFSIIFLSLSTCAFAQYYDTLPKGVRLISAKYIKSEINSSYNQSQSESPYTFNIDANIDNLEDINHPDVEEILNVFSDYPEAYGKLSLGNHKLEGKADLTVNVYAFGYGITDRITAYIGMPIFDATVNLKYSRSKSSSNEEVAEILQKEYGDDWAQTLGNIVENIFDVDENLIQSGIVNTLGYEDLGNWSGKGLGDIEFGLMYNFFRKKNYGIMATVGGVAPTGYVNDPDILQDISFGDGQWDAFIELGGGYILSPSTVLNAWSRYTYQFESKKTLRTPYSEDVFLSDSKDEYTEKLGNKLDFGVNIELHLNDWFKLQPNYVINNTEKAIYKSNNPEADRILALNTNSYSQSFGASAELSSIKLFKQDKFLLPAKINFGFLRMLEGKNTPKVDLFEVDFRMFF